MNWVGGARSRYMMRGDTKKQREFFEKKKMNSKLHNLGIPVTTSHKGTGSGSMDLVTLFIVNQIAAKKEIKDKPVVTVLGDGKGRMKNRPLELPMSPGSPSQLSLSESEPYYSVQRVKRRKPLMSDAFRCQQLSPVLESSFSEHKSSDPVKRHVSPGLSPSSLACSASSRPGPGAVFPRRPDLQHRNLSQLHPCTPSPPAWTTSDLQDTQFRPFSRPGPMRDVTQWSSGSSMPCYLPDPQSVSRALFRSPLLQDGLARDQEGFSSFPREEGDQGSLARDQEGFSSFPISQSEDRLPLLGFTLDQSETEEPFEEELFSGFASNFLRLQSEINLIEETPAAVSTLQNPRDPQRADCKDKTLTLVPSCTNRSSACLECSPSYSPTDCGCSSDSESDAADCQLCLLAGRSNTSEDVNALNKSSQWTPQVPRPSRPPTPYKQPPGKSLDEQPVDRKSVSGDGGALQPEGDREQTASHQVAGPPPESEPHSPPDTRDSATQTCDVTKRQTSDASTQSEACVPVTGYVGAPVGRAVPPHATGGQTRSSQDGDAAAPGAMLLAGSQRGDDGPWRRGSREEGRGHYISGNAIRHGTLNTEGTVGRDHSPPPPHWHE
uniref:Uncharacterized protein n=1 Tax=Gadus morhua TaxID=8049 RepID=A0A8C5FNY7_GADMO